MKKTLILMVLCMMASIGTCFAIDTNHLIGTNVLTIHNEQNAPVHAIMTPADLPYHITKTAITNGDGSGIWIARW